MRSQRSAGNSARSTSRTAAPFQAGCRGCTPGRDESFLARLGGRREDGAERHREDDENGASSGDQTRVQEPERSTAKRLQQSAETADRHVREEEVEIVD